MKIYGNSDGKPFGEQKQKPYFVVTEGDSTSLIYKNGNKIKYHSVLMSCWKEIQYPPSWPNAFKYRWEPLSKLPAPEGFVYIGKGGEEKENELKYFFAYDDIWAEGLTSGSGFNGSIDSFNYYVKKETWNNKFKKETKMKTLRVYTPYDKAAAELVRKMAEERGFGYSWHKYWILGDTLISNNVNFDSANDEWASRRDYKLIPLHEFIHELGKLPVKEKEIVIDILPWKVVIRGEKCDIGCRKDVRVADLVLTINSIENSSGVIVELDKGITLGKGGFSAEGYFVSWETLDKFKRELSLLTPPSL